MFEGQKRSEATVETDLNPICHVLTVLMKGLRRERPLYPLIPAVCFVPPLPCCASPASPGASFVRQTGPIKYFSEEEMRQPSIRGQR